MCLAIPGRVVEIVDPQLQLAAVEIAGVRRTVNVGLLEAEGVEIGDWILIHVGFALSKVDEAEAETTLALLRGQGQDFDDAVAEIQQSVAR